MKIGDKELFFEIVIEKIGPHITQSELRPATQKDIETAQKLHKNGKCTHLVVYDEPGAIYDARICYICGDTSWV